MKKKLVSLMLAVSIICPMAAGATSVNDLASLQSMLITLNLLVAQVEAQIAALTSSVASTSSSSINTLPVVVLASTEAIKDNSDPTTGGSDVGHYTIKFKVTAGSEDAYISSQVSKIRSASSITYQVSNQTTSTSTGSLDSTATLTSRGYLVSAGKSETFTLTVTVTATASAFHKVTLDNITGVTASGQPINIIPSSADYTTNSLYLQRYGSNSSNDDTTTTATSSIYISLLSTDVAKDNSDPTTGGSDVGHYTIKFKVTAGNGDVYIERGSLQSTSPSTSAITYTVTNISSGRVENSLDSTATLTSRGYLVSAGKSETFTLTVTVTATASAFHKVTLTGLAWKDNNGTARVYVTNANDFATDNIYLQFTTGTTISPATTTPAVAAISFNYPSDDTVWTAGQSGKVSWSGTGFSTNQTGYLYLYTSTGAMVANPYQDYINRNMKIDGWNLSLSGASFNPTLRKDLPAGTYYFVFKYNGAEVGRSNSFTVTGATTTAQNISLNQMANVLTSLKEIIEALK